MAIIKFSNGVLVQFNGNPTQKDIDEVAAQLQANTSAPATPSPQTDALTKTTNAVTSVFPGKAIGESLATSLGAVKDIGLGAFHLLTGNKQAAKQDYARIQAAADENSQNFGKIVGDTVSALSLPASLAVGSPEITTIPKTAAKAALQTGAFAAASGGGESLAMGNDAKTAAVDAFRSGLIGAFVGGVAGGATAAVKKAAERTPEALYNNALKVSQKIKMADKSPAPFLKDEGIWGSLGTMYKTAQEGIDTENAKIAQNVEALKMPAPTFADIKVKATDILSRSLGGLYSKPELESLIESVPVSAIKDETSSLNWKQFNDVRSKLGSLIGDSKWLSTTPSERTKAAQAVYGAMADAVQKASGTSEQFYRLSNWIRAKKLIGAAINKADTKYGLGLYDYIAGGFGAAIGGISGGDPVERTKNAILGGASSIVAERTLNSPALKTGLAQVIQHLSELPVDNLGRVSRAAVVDLISRLVPQDQQQPQ